MILTAHASNASVDCYSQAPIDKVLLLAIMQEKFGLLYEILDEPLSINATGSKSHYYSLNRNASDFGFKPKFSSIEGLIYELGKFKKI
jgi:hypothetical protein